MYYTVILRNYDLFFQLGTDLEMRWGKSIIYEQAIPLVLYLGCKDIFTIGWDIGDLSIFKNKDPYEDVFNDHFYENKDELKVTIPANYREMQIVIESTKFFNEWLNGKGIDLKIISDRSAVHESVPRMEL